MGKTPQYDKYLNSRRLLGKRLFIPYPLMRKISCQCVMVLPDILVDLRKYREQPFEMPLLIELINDGIINGTLFIQQFYEKIIKLAQTDTTEFRSKISKLHYWCTGTGILASSFIKLIRQTIFHIVKVSGDDENVPFLKLYLQYDNKLNLYPSKDETVEMYLKFIRQIANAANDLLSLESIFCEGFEDKKIPIFLQQSFMDDAKQQIETNLTRMFRPVEQYVSNLEQGYSSVYGGML